MDHVSCYRCGAPVPPMDAYCDACLSSAQRDIPMDDD